MNRSFTLALLLVAFALPGNSATAAEAGWVSLFDGKSLSGWTASENKESCRVEDGNIVVGGERSHLFYSGEVGNHDFDDFELKLEVKTTPGSNSGVFFHTTCQEEGWPNQGYEAQVNQSHGDWRRTGSIYSVKDLRETPAKDDQWFDYHVIVRDKHITVKVNGQTVNDYTEPDDIQPPEDRPNQKLSHGTIALQAHDPGSTVYYRNIRIKLPPSSTAQAAATASAATSCKSSRSKRCSPKSKRRLFRRKCRR